MNNTKRHKIPRFTSEDQERAFWATEDSADYIDWSHAVKTTMSHLRPSVKSISLRLPEALLERLKVLANKHDVPYQSLMKMYLSERVARESTPRYHVASQLHAPKHARRATESSRALR